VQNAEIATVALISALRDVTTGLDFPVLQIHSKPEYLRGKQGVADGMGTKKKACVQRAGDGVW
jgi:hypothetical protein